MGRLVDTGPPLRYDEYKKPDWTPGSSYGVIAAGYVITGMLDGIAIYAGLQVSRYELFKSVSTAIVFLFFKAFYFIWPALLFYFGNLIMQQSVLSLSGSFPALWLSLSSRFPHSYEELSHPDFLPSGTFFPISGAGLVFTGLFEGGALMAAIHSTDYKVVHSKLILNIGLNFKILTYLWPVFLFGYTQLMVVGIPKRKGRETGFKGPTAAAAQFQLTLYHTPLTTSS
eukprot:sb/3469594/